MSDEEIHIGIIGAGANTRLRHIPGLRAVDNVKIAAVANQTFESSEKAAKELDIPFACSHWHEIMDDENIDAVCIGTWPYMHEALTTTALEAGKHVLCEARMASNIDEALSMMNTSKLYSNLVTQLVPAPISLKADNQIISMIENGDIGNITAIDLVGASLDPGDPELALTWRQDLNYSGRNTMTLGIWYEMLMRWVGTAKNVNAISRTTVPFRKDANGVSRPVNIPDHLEILGEMTNGATLHMRISAVLHKDQCGVNIFGDKGTIRFADGKLLYAKKGEELNDVPLEGKDWDVEADFINSIRTGAPVTLTSFADGVRYMAFTEAVLSSAAKRETVPVEVF